MSDLGADCGHEKCVGEPAELHGQMVATRTCHRCGIADERARAEKAERELSHAEALLREADGTIATLERERDEARAKSANLRKIAKQRLATIEAVKALVERWQRDVNTRQLGDANWYGTSIASLAADELEAALGEER